VQVQYRRRTPPPTATPRFASPWLAATSLQTPLYKSSFGPTTAEIRAVDNRALLVRNGLPPWPAPGAYDPPEYNSLVLLLLLLFLLLL
jgi:hypothetical protein